MFKKIALLFCVAVLFASTSETAFAVDIKTWNKKVAKKVRNAQKYPPSAVSNEIEGRAEIVLTIAANGKVISSEIKKKTGHAVLDREIPKIIKKLSSLPALPKGESEKRLTIPLNWKLN